MGAYGSEFGRRVEIEAARDAVAHVRRLLLLDDRGYVHLQLADVRLVPILDERDVQEQIAIPFPRVPGNANF